MTNVFLGSVELGEAFGASAAAWADIGLTVLRGTPADPGAAGEITVRRGEEVLGFTEISPAHDGRRVYRVVITTGHHGVPLPAGFLPPDPVRVQHNQRLRRLPADHPDRPVEGTVRCSLYLDA